MYGRIAKSTESFCVIRSAFPDVNTLHNRGKFVQAKTIKISTVLVTKLQALLGCHQVFHSCPFCVPGPNSELYDAFLSSNLLSPLQPVSISRSLAVLRDFDTNAH